MCNLSVKDRLVLINVLPKEGDFRTIKSLRKVREALSFTEKEQEVLDFQSKDGMMTWTEPGKDETSLREIDIPGSIVGVITDTLTRLNDQKKLTEDLFELYEMFVDND